MKLCITSPTNGTGKSVEVDDPKVLLPFFEKRLGAEVPGDSLGPEWAGYVFRIAGGNDKQGFPMLQGVLCNHRVRLLMRDGMKGFRERRKGCPRRKSIRGCIVAGDISALALVVVEKGPGEIEGLTDKTIPAKYGPKRASKIRRLFGLSKEEDPRPYAIKVQAKNGKWKAPKVTRLVTAEKLARKAKQRALKLAALKSSTEQRRAYKKTLAEWKAAQPPRTTNPPKTTTPPPTHA